MAGCGWWQFMGGADTVDPGVNFVRIYIEASRDLRVRFSDHRSFPRVPRLSLSIAFGAGRLICVEVQRIHEI